MAGIQRSKEYDTHSEEEEDELQFQLELGEAPLPASTVATFDTYISNRYSHLESSRPAGGHALGNPRDFPHEPEPPRKPSSLYLLWDHPDKIQSSPKIMAAQAMEALNRTFIELKSKNDETRLRASHDLRDLVVSAARGKAFCLLRSSCTG